MIGERVLVCGGRDFGDRFSAYTELDQVKLRRGVSVIIEGGALGADRIARDWAKLRGIEFLTFEADWQKDGRAAGPIRNRRMLDEGRPTLVVAFPGGRGTADMLRQARRAGIEIELVQS